MAKIAKGSIRRFFRCMFGLNEDPTKMFSECSPEAIKESREYRHFKNKVLKNRINQVIRNYKDSPDNFDLSTLELIEREIDSATKLELNHVHRELARQLTEIHNNLLSMYGRISEQSSEVAIYIQTVEREWENMERFLIEYQRQVIEDENPPDEPVLEIPEPENN